MNPRILFPALLAVALLEAQIAAPQPGFVRYEDRSVHIAYGIPGNLVLEKHSTDLADAISFSDSGGLLAKGGRITLVRRDLSVVAELESGEPAPVLNLGHDLSTAVAWLPQAHRLLFWSGTRFQLQDSAFQGTVTSIAVSAPGLAQMLQTNPDRSVSSVTVSLKTGNVISSDTLPGVRGPAFLASEFLISIHDAGLEIDGPDRHRQTLAFSEHDFTAERMSLRWVHLSAGSKHWALYLGTSGATLSQLPPANAGPVQ